MKNSKIKKLAVIILLIGIFFIASIPAFRSAVYEGHDLNFHLGRIQAIADALREGQIPVRYEQNAWYGHGYVSSLYYGNVFLYFPAILYNLGLPIYRVYNIYIILVNIITVCLGYYSFKRILKDSYWGIAATCIYMLAGYRLANLYVRTTLGEYTAMAFLPLFMYGLYRVYIEKTNVKLYDYWPLIISTTGFIQSHILSTIMVALYAIVHAVINYKKTFKEIKRILMSIGIVCLINAFFLVPFIQSYFIQDLNINNSVGGDDISKSGLILKQLFGIVTYNTQTPSEHAPSYNVGLLIILCEIVSVLWVINILHRKLKMENGRANQETQGYMFILFVMGIITSVMSTRYFPWKIVGRIPVLGALLTSIQFPSRYILLQTVCFVAVGVYGMSQLVLSERARNIIVPSIFALSILTTAIFDYTLSFGVNITNQNADEMWADKLYLPVGTKVDELVNVNIIEEGDYYILPVLAYDNVCVFDFDGNKIETYKSENNCLEISKQYDPEMITIAYVEPKLWRIMEIISLLSVIIFVVRCLYIRIKYSR